MVKQQQKHILSDHRHLIILKDNKIYLVQYGNFSLMKFTELHLLVTVKRKQLRLKCWFARAMLIVQSSNPTCFTMYFSLLPIHFPVNKGERQVVVFFLRKCQIANILILAAFLHRFSSVSHAYLVYRQLPFLRQLGVFLRDSLFIFITS